MNKDKAESNLIVKLSFEFSVSVIEYCLLLEEDRKYVISNQLLKAGTSIGANIREAQNAESANDFIHKIKIAAKEADECEYWLWLIKELNYKHKNLFPNPDPLLKQLSSIMKILNKIIVTMKKKSSNKQPGHKD